MGGHRLQRQAGISLVGLIVAIAILGFFLVLGGKILPTFSEYRAICSAIEKAKASGNSVKEIQDSFNRSAEVGYIDSISGSDLVIERVGGGMEVSFAYEKKIPLFGPASILLEYSGSTAKGGKTPAAEQ
jgi:hypothetical protein